MTFEKPGEISVVFKVQGFGNLAHHEVGVGQHTFRFEQNTLPDEFAGAFPHSGIGERVEVIGRDEHHFGVFPGEAFFTEMLLDQFFKLAHEHQVVFGHAILEGIGRHPGKPDEDHNEHTAQNIHSKIGPFVKFIQHLSERLFYF